MEALLIGLLALKAIRKPEKVATEPEEFQAFDLRTLDRLYNARENSSVETRNGSYLAQAQS
jgi:hypothetical protein